MEATTTNLQAALGFLRRGWCPIPLCWPDEQGRCACGRGHEGHDVGKAPLLGAGYQELRPTEGDVRRWWQRWPSANIGILLEPSNLVFIGPDTPESVSWAARQPGGLPPTTIRYSNNPGYLYRRPEGCPVATVKHRPEPAIEVDVKTNGYCVAYGTHRTGCQVYVDDAEPTEPPEWAVQLLRKQGGNGHRCEPLPDTLPVVAVSGLRVSDRIKVLILTGEDTTRYPSRSEALFGVLEALIAAGYDDQTIASVILANPIGEKAREQGRRWLEGEIGRARAKAGDDDPPEQPIAVMNRFHARPFALRILASHRFLATGKAGRGDFYRFDAEAGLWRDDAEAFLDHLLRQGTLLSDELKRSYYIDEIIADVRGLSWRPEGMPEPSPYLVPFANGVFDLRTSALRPFEPEDYFTWRLPWPYDPTAKSVFLQDKLANFDEGIRRHFFELLAYCLWRGYPFQRFFLWVGRGSNGKGFLANVLTYALGADNVSGVSLADIQNERFAGANLYRKLANIAGEISYSDLENTDLLKKATGTDFLDADRKYRDPIRFKNCAKLLFLTNEVPKTRDTTDAFYRRTFIVHFENQFAEDPRVVNELELLATSEKGRPEFAWLLTKALAVLRDLLQRNFVFHGTLPVAEARALYESLSNPLRQFIEENCTRTRSPNDYIYKFEFAERLNDWLTERGHNRYSDHRLGSEMKAMGIESGQRGAAPTKWWAWLGLTWKQACGQSQESQESQLISNNFPERVEKLFQKTCDSCDSCDLDPTDWPAAALFRPGEVVVPVAGGEPARTVKAWVGADKRVMYQLADGRTFSQAELDEAEPPPRGREASR